MSRFLDPFQILLNNLSHELNDGNLQSLIHVCGELIPGGQREKINSGWDVFSILRQQNIIGSDPEKIVNLLSIMKVLKPKRRDLVLKVKQHIEDNYEPPEMILKDFESSADSKLPPVISRPSTAIPTAEDCCRIRCGCFTCNCNPCCDGCCCCVILAILFSFLAIAAALAWYSSIPQITKHLKSNEDLKQAGPFVIGVLGFLAVCSVSCGIYIRYRAKPPCRNAMPRDEPDELTPPIGMIRCSSETSDQASNARKTDRSNSSGQFTLSSSRASRASSQISVQ